MGPRATSNRSDPETEIEVKIVFKNKKFLIGGLVIFSAIGFLGLKSFSGAATYYYTVTEVLAKGNSVYGDNVRVEGVVLEGSEKRESAGRLLKFIISDNESTQSIPVVYNGVIPDTFKEGNPVVVEGVLNSDGVFQATTLMPKCPSKYEAEAPEAKQPGSY